MQHDEKYAIYTLLEGHKWVIFGKTAKPHLQMSRRIKTNKTGLRMHRQEIYWFQDKTLALRVHADVCSFLRTVGIKRAGDNRSPKFHISVKNIDDLIQLCAAKANIPIESEEDQRWSQAQRDNKVMHKLRQRGIE